MKRYYLSGTILLKRVYNLSVGLGGLGVTCSPQDPRFVGSNPAEVDKNPEHKSLV